MQLDNCKAVLPACLPACWTEAETQATIVLNWVDTQGVIDLDDYGGESQHVFTTAAGRQ